MKAQRKALAAKLKSQPYDPAQHIAGHQVLMHMRQIEGGDESAERKQQLSQVVAFFEQTKTATGRSSVR